MGVEKNTYKIQVGDARKVHFSIEEYGFLCSKSPTHGEGLGEYKKESIKIATR